MTYDPEKHHRKSIRLKGYDYSWPGAYFVTICANKHKCVFGKVAKCINEVRDAPGAPVWQRNYYEHVVRDHDDLTRIRQYIYNNSACWEEDEENPTNYTR